MRRAQHERSGAPGDGPYTIKYRAVAGDLTVGIGAAPDSVLGGLSGMLRSIRQMVAQIASGAPTLKETAESLSHASAQVATASHYQADLTSSMVAAIEQNSLTKPNFAPLN